MANDLLKFMSYDPETVSLHVRLETGQLDYLTDGLSPNNARRMSASSAISREGGDRDSLLPTWDSLKSNSVAGAEDDSGSMIGREVRISHGFQGVPCTTGKTSNS